MKNNSVIFAVVNRNGKALLVNGNTKQYTEFNHSNSSKASLVAIAKLLDRVADSDKYDTVTIIVPKNLAFMLRKESVYNWLNNSNTTKAGNKLDDEFITLCKYISDMRNYLGNRVKVKMTGTSIVSVAEEQLMSQAWKQLDKITGREIVSVSKAKPVLPQMNSNN